MKLRYVLLMIILTGMFFSCATSKDMERLEAKVDRLLLATNRSTLEEIFGVQAVDISKRLDQVSESQKEQFDHLAHDYAKGTMALEDVREKMLTLLGNTDRVVSTQRGIYIRDLHGVKIRAISNGTKLKSCHQLDDSKIPEFIAGHNYLKTFTWGEGMLDDKPVLFPWELTMSNFTKEIVENTARRTAQEFIKMGGDKKWKRPIYIQLSTESEEQFKISTPDSENEIYVMPIKTDAQKSSSAK